MKLHLITRKDLPLEQQAIQPAHALTEYSLQCQDVFLEWYQKSNTLALLTVSDETVLQGLLDEAQDKGISVAGFREPDRDNELTAIAIGPEGKKLCRRLPLALFA